MRLIWKEGYLRRKWRAKGSNGVVLTVRSIKDSDLRDLFINTGSGETLLRAGMNGEEAFHTGQYYEDHGQIPSA